MDPHAALGLPPDASPEEVARAYRRLAKRHHPDRRPQDAEDAAARMAEINAAYAMLRDDLMAQQEARRPAARRTGDDRPPPGAWLDARIRRALGSELLRVLEPEEPVTLVTDAATWDSHHVRLALSDRRLLWLRDDAPTDRVKFLRLRGIERVEGRLRGRRQRVGELLVHPRDGRRLSFGELEPSALRLLLQHLRSRLH